MGIGLVTSQSGNGTLSSNWLPMYLMIWSLTEKNGDRKYLTALDSQSKPRQCLSESEQMKGECLSSSVCDFELAAMCVWHSRQLASNNSFS